MYNIALPPPTVSIIIPCYNVEQFIERCINSIINQTYSNTEIIAINDCSTDSTLEILKKIKETRNINLHIINLEINRGVGEARDIGLVLATGKYVMFIDADDWIHKNTINTCRELIEKYNVELVEFKLKRVSYFIDEEICTNPKFSVIQTKHKIENKCDHVSTNKLYRRDLIINHNLKFKYRIFEDTLFTRKYCMLCNKAIFIDCQLYYYFINPKSTTAILAQKTLQDNTRTEEVLDFYTKHNLNNNKEKYIDNSIKFIIRHLIPLSHRHHSEFVFTNKNGAFALRCKDIIESYNKSGFIFRLKSYFFLGLRNSIRFILKYGI